MGKSLEQFQVTQDAKLKELANTVVTVWKNQVELAESETRLDEQFCVLSRLAIRGINDILIRIGSEDLITDKVVEAAFKEWRAFRKRSDYRKFMLEWFLGKSLSELPTEPKKEEILVAPDPKVGGAQEFGGNYVSYNKSDNGNTTTAEERQQDSNSCQTDEVPSGQNLDGSIPDGGQGNSPALS